MPKGKPHDARVDVRAFSAEVALWKEVAEHRGLTLANWVRVELNRLARKYAAAHGIKVPEKQ